MQPKISIIVPNYNCGQFIAECLDSIVSQDWPNKEILVIDGGSNDLSPMIIRSFERHLTHWVSAPDAGQYFAVEKGMNLATGDVLCWLNSDDRLFPGALREVMETFQQCPDLQWLTGAHSFFSERKAHGGAQTRDAFFHDPEMQYDVRTMKTSHFVNWSWHYLINSSHYEHSWFLQQESTFWKRSLWNSVGGFDHTYRLACDYWLWMEFLDRAPLLMLDRPLGCFRQWEGQCTANRKDDYIAESLAIAANWKSRDRLRQRHALASPMSNAEAAKNDLHPSTSSGGSGCESLTDNLATRVDHQQVQQLVPRDILRVKGSIRDRVCLATSIAPKDLPRQEAAVQSWLHQGCRVVSLNTQAEIDVLRASTEPGIAQLEYIPIQDTARHLTGIDLPYIRDFVRFFQTLDKSSYVGLINSDIRVEYHIDLYSLLRDRCTETTCLLSSRLDHHGWPPVHSEGYRYGYDAFFFRPEFLDDYPLDTDYAIGAPWWDYYMALYCVRRAEMVFRCEPIPFYHYFHIAQYPLDLWYLFGYRFLNDFHTDLEHSKTDPVVDPVHVLGEEQHLQRVATQFVKLVERSSVPVAPMPWARRWNTITPTFPLAAAGESGSLPLLRNCQPQPMVPAVLPLRRAS
jgi:glycosyltransferase involved in cell wall biosynthesis